MSPFLLKKMLVKRRLLFVVLLGLVLIGLFAGTRVNAASRSYDTFIGDCNLTEFGCWLMIIPTALFWAVGSLFGMLAAFFGYLTHWMIGFGTEVIRFPVVRMGFAVSLNVVNLLFVMGLIIAAFQIILNFKAPQAKKMVALIILAAVLVNFSMLIAGFLLDISNVFTDFFISRFTPDSIGNAFSANNIDYNLVPPPYSMPKNTLGTFLIMIQLAFLRIILFSVMAIALLATFIMALVRNLWVAGLLILMPLSWGVWGFPSLQKYHSQWWDNFLKWGLMYLPSMTFFFWLATQTAELMFEFTSGFSGGPTLNLGSGPVGAALGNVAMNAIQILLLVGLLITGLKVAQKMGGFGSNIGMNLAGRAGRLGAKLSWRAGLKTTRGAARLTGAQRGAKAAGRGLARALTWQPAADKKGFGAGAARAVVGGLRGILTGGQSKRLAGTLNKAGDYTKEAEQKQKAYENLSNSQFKDQLKTPLRLLDPSGRIAMFKEAAKRDMLDEINEEDALKYAEAMQMANPGKKPHEIDELKKLAAIFPRLSQKITKKSMSETLAKAKGEDVAKNKKNLEGPEGREILGLLNKNQILSIIRSSSANEAVVTTTLAEDLAERGGLQKEGAEIKSWNVAIKTSKAKEERAEKKGDKKAAKEARAALRQALADRDAVIDKIDINNPALSAVGRDIVSKLKSMSYTIGSNKAQRASDKMSATPSASENKKMPQTGSKFFGDDYNL